MNLQVRIHVHEGDQKLAGEEERAGVGDRDLPGVEGTRLRIGDRDLRL